MSKFLDLVVESTPSEGKGPFTVEYKDVEGNLMATAIIPDNVGSSYDNFIKFVESSGGKLNVEDAEMSMSDAIGAVAGIPDQGLKKNLMSPTARALTGAKKNMAKAAKNISKKMLDASKTI